MKIIIILLTILLFSSCSKQDKESSCSITVDSVSIIDSYSYKNKTYYLVHRISGWSDKTEILELYDRKPIFDHCSKAKTKVVFGDSLELSKTVDHVYLNIEESTLEIEYTDKEPSRKHNSELKLEVR